MNKHPDRFAAMRRVLGKSTLADTLLLNQKAEAEMKSVTKGIYKHGEERQKVEAFLKSLNFDEYDTADVLENCSTDPDARRYWVQRAKGDAI